MQWVQILIRAVDLLPFVFSFCVKNQLEYALRRLLVDSMHRCVVGL